MGRSNRAKSVVSKDKLMLDEALTLTESQMEYIGSLLPCRHDLHPKTTWAQCNTCGKRWTPERGWYNLTIHDFKTIDDFKEQSNE